MVAMAVGPAAAAAREWDDWSLHEAMSKTPERKRMRMVAVQVADGVLDFDESGSPGSSSTVVVEQVPPSCAGSGHVVLEDQGGLTVHQQGCLSGVSGAQDVTERQDGAKRMVKQRPVDE